MMIGRKTLTGKSLEITLTAANSAAQALYGFDQGIISGILISSDFISRFPQTKDASIQGITASCFSVCFLSFTPIPLTFVLIHLCGLIALYSWVTSLVVCLQRYSAIGLAGRIHFELAQ